MTDPMTTDFAVIRCPRLMRGCRGGCEWRCPSCGHLCQHEQYCPRCLLNFCATCLGAGVITDDSYLWNSPRTVICPECS